MLARQGAAALNWVHSGLANVGAAVEMGDYYMRRMGLRVDVWEGGVWREAGRVTQVGPIAWSGVAVAFPVPPGPEVRVRLRFVADAWRIDWAALTEARTVPVRMVPLARVEAADDADAPALTARLARADRPYAVTYPGDRFTARPDASTLAAVRALLAEAARVADLTAASAPDADLDALWVALWADVTRRLPSEQRGAIAHFAE